MKTPTNVVYLIFALTTFASFALAPTLRAVNPPPDGGYAGGNTAEGQDAPSGLETADVVQDSTVSTDTASTEAMDAQWVPTGSLHTGRYYYAATVLQDGRVLVSGGISPSFANTASAELYDPATGVWTTTGSMHQARAGHTQTLLLNGKVLVTGAAPDSRAAELYDPATGTWSVTGSMITSRFQGHSATLLRNGMVLVAGGETASAEIYDPASGTWSATGSMGMAQTFHTATLLPGGSVLVAGGSPRGGVYHPSSGTWSTTSSFGHSGGRRQSDLIAEWAGAFGRRWG